MSFVSRTKVANGNIKPSRFTKYDTSADDKVLQASTGDKICGISFPYVRRLPGDLGLDDGFHAIAGKDCGIYGPDAGEVLLCLGGTVVNGDRLKSDSDGCGVATTTPQDEIGAEARQGGSAGQLIRVMPISPARL